MIAAVSIWLFALIWFAQVAQDAAALSQLQNGILVVSVIGIAVLLLLIIGNLVQLIRDYRRHVPGVRLKARMVTLLVVLTVVPLLVVYTFSLQFINRGIDSWFSLEVEEGLETALELSRSALDVQMRENLASARQMAQQITGTNRADIVSELGDLRRASGAVELTLFAATNDQILATSAEDPSLAVPQYPNDELIFPVRQAEGSS